MLIQHRQAKGKGSFFIEADGNILAEMVYTMPIAAYGPVMDCNIAAAALLILLLITIVFLKRLQNLLH